MNEHKLLTLDDISFLEQRLTAMEMKQYHDDASAFLRLTARETAIERIQWFFSMRRKYTDFKDHYIL